MIEMLENVKKQIDNSISELERVIKVFKNNGYPTDEMKVQLAKAKKGRAKMIRGINRLKNKKINASTVEAKQGEQNG